jgi:hypothetical protein
MPYDFFCMTKKYGIASSRLRYDSPYHLSNPHQKNNQFELALKRRISGLKRVVFLSLIFVLGLWLQGQQLNCLLKNPQITIHFGKGEVSDVNTEYLGNYSRVRTYCPTDGHFSYSSHTSECFSNDWHTLTEDHTPGDENGNMLLVNGAPSPGVFLKTTIPGLKPSTTYEFGVWLMNLCKITDKCPFPLLPNLTIRIQSSDGKVLAAFNTRELPRVQAPAWTQHRAVFTTSAAGGTLTLTMMNNAPGGCGNDFALDDITFRECVKVTTLTTSLPKPAPQKKPPVAVKQAPKKASPPEKSTETNTPKPATSSSARRVSVYKDEREFFPPPPSVLTNRDNALVKRIEAPAGEIQVELYDNGEIDGDTVSIYHNNVLVKSHARLSAKPISFSISINPSQPYHELIMVADNLGSIPPNTSVMIITAGNTRHELFISSTEQKNAKVILDLKK